MKFDKNTKPKKWKIHDVESASHAKQVIDAYGVLFRQAFNNVLKITAKGKFEINGIEKRGKFAILYITHTELVAWQPTCNLHLVPAAPFTLIIEP